MNKSGKKIRQLTEEEYRHEMARINRKGSNGFLWFLGALLVFLLLFGGFLLVLFSSQGYAAKVGPGLHLFAVKAVRPFFLSLGGVVLLLVLYCLVRALRCPHCHRFFARGKFRHHDTTHGQTAGIDSGGDYYYRQSATTVWWTRCKKCGKPVLKIR